MRRGLRARRGNRGDRETISLATSLAQSVTTAKLGASVGDFPRDFLRAATVLHGARYVQGEGSLCGVSVRVEEFRRAERAWKIDAR